MAFAFDEIFAYGGQLIVAERSSKALGMGEEKIDHSAYIEGNTQIGKVDAFSSASATLMVGREGTKGTSLAVNTKGHQRIDGDGGTANGLYVSGGSSVDAVYIQGDLYVSGSIDGGNKGDSLQDLVLLMVNQNHLTSNTQVKRDGDLDMLVLKAQRWVCIVEVELEEKK